MKVLFWGLTIFCLSFLLHLVIWKIHLPKRQTDTLLQIFFGGLIIGVLILWGIQDFMPLLGTYIPEDLSEYLHISLFVISLTLAYVITYSGLEADSPSLVMIMTIANAGSDGLAKKSFMQTMSDETLVKPRIMDLVRDKMVYMDKDRYKPTLKGSLFVLIFILYRKLLNLQKGG